MGKGEQAIGVEGECRELEEVGAVWNIDLTHESSGVRVSNHCLLNKGTWHVFPTHPFGFRALYR